MYQIHVNISDTECRFTPAPKAACPINCNDLKYCDNDMNNGELCRGGRYWPALPANINNCCGGYDVFICAKGMYQIGNFMNQ